jgi:hypothetical protein
MKHLLPIFTATIILAGCTANTGKNNVSFERLLENPLFAERYGDEMVNMYVDLAIREDPIFENARMEKYINDRRRHWLQAARDATKEQEKGGIGQFIAVKEPLKGEVLYLDNKLYLDTIFYATPSPNLRLHITTVVDPRNIEFPDETSIDIGELVSPYGAQEYDVTPVENPILYRTVVLWDKKLNRLHGFAQLTFVNP